MISKKQYQQLKQLCRSKNPDDVLLVGSVILSLRNRKQLKMRMVNELFILVAGKLMFGDNFDDGIYDKVKRDKYKHYVWNTKTKSYLTKLDYKWKWLNGTL